MSAPRSVHDILHLVDQATLEELDVLENRLIERKFALGVGKFNRGKIYKVTLDGVIVYVGSTVKSLELRWAGHKSHFRTCPNTLWSQFVTQNGGPDRFVISLIEEVPCRNLKELLKREGELIAELNPVCNVMMNSPSPTKNSVFDLEISTSNIPSFVDIPSIESNQDFRECVVTASEHSSLGHAKAVFVLFKYAYVKWIMTEAIPSDDQAFIFDHVVRSKSSLQILLNIIRCCGKTVGCLSGHVCAFVEKQTGILLPQSPVNRVETRQFCSHLGVSCLGEFNVNMSQNCKAGMLTLLKSTHKTDRDLNRTLLVSLEKFLSSFGLQARYDEHCRLCISYKNEFSKRAFECGVAQVYERNKLSKYVELPLISDEVYTEYWKAKISRNDTSFSNAAIEKYLFVKCIIGDSMSVAEKDRAFIFDDYQNDKIHKDLLFQVYSTCKDDAFNRFMKDLSIRPYLETMCINGPISVYLKKIGSILGLESVYDTVNVIDHSCIKSNLESLAVIIDKCMIILRKPKLDLSDIDLKEGKQFKRILYKLQMLFRQWLGLQLTNIKERKGKTRDGIYQLKFVDSFSEVLYTCGIV